MKKELLSSKVIGTDDTSVKVLDRKLPFARTGRIWPYVGDAHHPVILYDYTPTRARAGPAKFLEGYKGYLQADAYSVYDAFFKPQRGMIEVGCWMHARRYLFKALESDEPHMGPALHLIARLYAVEERAKALSLSAEQRLALRQRVSARLIGKLHQYLLEMQPEVLPKSPSGAAVRYALNQWEALTRFLRRRRFGDRQRRHRTGHPRYRGGPRQLDVLRQRRRRQDGGGAAELRRFLQAVRRRAVRLVPRRALAHPGPLHHPAHRIASAQLEADNFPIPGLSNPPIPHVSRPLPTAVHETLTK